ncbi:hypothetical protein BC835DRAFT_650625 [Cytidiella melzeri]|nr:hypothetical protein BC835DRAFT_650625 [Cytidiella melzeri]
MSFVAARASPTRAHGLFTQKRSMSASPYGRTHVWKHRPRKLPNPCVPQFPQQVVRADGSTFTHFTTSPRSTINLTRDSTNNPMWAPFFGNKEDAESAALAGRLGRFNKKFDGLGGLGEDMDWLSSDQDGVADKKKSP